MLTSSEDEANSATDEIVAGPCHKSRRPLLRMPFKILRGVTLGRGDNGTLAFKALYLKFDDRRCTNFSTSTTAKFQLPNDTNASPRDPLLRYVK